MSARLHICSSASHTPVQLMVVEQRSLERYMAFWSDTIGKRTVSKLLQAHGFVTPHTATLTGKCKRVGTPCVLLRDEFSDFVYHASLAMGERCKAPPTLTFFDISSINSAKK